VLRRMARFLLHVLLTLNSLILNNAFFVIFPKGILEKSVILMLIYSFINLF
jgi:hypothetical protein